MNPDSIKSGNAWRDFPDEGDTMRKIIAAASAGAEGQLPDGWECGSADGGTVVRNTISGIALASKIIP